MLWFLQADPQLCATAKNRIEDPANQKLVSIVSCWKLVIKSGLKKLDLGETSQSFLARELPKNNFELLPISLEHATAVEALPAHHRDAFDRLLIAQTIVEGIPIISRDTQFDAYPVIRFWN